MGSKRPQESDPKLSDLILRSADEAFGVKIRGNELRKILKYCIGAQPLETGGILVGSYSDDHDVALVADVSKAPRDSKSGTTWFYRGVHGLQAWLCSLWNKNRYYLGEWHFHPDAKPIPSDTDLRQIREISESAKYSCPEPVLVIIGGCPPRAWELGVYVFPRGSALVELTRVAGD